MSEMVWGLEAVARPWVSEHESPHKRTDIAKEVTQVAPAAELNDKIGKLTLSALANEPER